MVLNWNLGGLGVGGEGILFVTETMGEEVGGGGIGR